MSKTLQQFRHHAQKLLLQLFAILLLALPFYIALYQRLMR